MPHKPFTGTSPAAEPRHYRRDRLQLSPCARSSGEATPHLLGVFVAGGQVITPYLYWQQAPAKGIILQV